MMMGAEGKPATYLVETADEPGPDRGNLGPPEFERGAELSQGIIIILYIFSLIEVLNYIREKGICSLYFLTVKYDIYFNPFEVTIEADSVFCLGGGGARFFEEQNFLRYL